MTEYIAIGFFLLVSLGFASAALLLSRMVAAKGRHGKDTLEPYECGEPSHGSSRIRFQPGYYLIALVFMIFDVETLFLFPCAILAKKIFKGELPEISPQFFAIEIGLFVGILFIGLIFVWRRRILRWE